MKEFSIEDLDAVIAQGREGSLAQMLSLQLKKQISFGEELEAQVKALAAEAAQMKAIIDSVTDLGNEPQFHEQGMGCGLEDRGITDRYAAMSYGWDQAMERVYGEVIPCAEELAFPATDTYLSHLRNEARAEGVEMFAEYQGKIASCYQKNSPGCVGEMEALLLVEVPVI